MRQLSLFKGPRQRGVAPPAPLEFSNHVLIADLLRRWCSKRWRWTHLPLGELRDFKFDKHGRRFSPAGQRLKRMGAQPGWPDFLFAGPGKSMAWLELKRKGNDLNENQEAVAAHLIDCGFDYLVTDNVREAVDWLKRLGILRATIGV
jgi:hypothetical protein